MPSIEKAIVNKDDVLGIQFQYTIAQIKVSSATTISANTASTIGNYYVRFRPNTTNTYTNLSSGTTLPTYSNQQYQTGYHLKPSPITHFVIQLVRVTSTSGSVSVVDTAIVPVIFAAGATFEITDEIKATVQGHTTAIGDINDDLETISNSISTINQRADSIQSQVTTNTNTINTLNGTVSSHTTSISTLTQKADSIESTVSSIRVSSGTNMFGFSRGLKYSNCIPFI